MPQSLRSLRHHPLSRFLVRLASLSLLSLSDGTSDTFNPKSAHKVIDGLVKLVVKELEKQTIL